MLAQKKNIFELCYCFCNNHLLATVNSLVYSSTVGHSYCDKTLEVIMLLISTMNTLFYIALYNFIDAKILYMILIIVHFNLSKNFKL